MEILSDSSFRGKATFLNGIEVCGGSNSANFSNAVSVSIGCLYLNNSKLSGNGSKQWNLPSSSGTLALTSQIPSLSGYLTTSAASSTYLSKTDASSTYVKKVDALKYKRVPINFDVPENCTKFFTADGTGVCSENVVSLNLLKNEAISLGQSNCFAAKQVQADVWAITGGQFFVVEKSSAFAIGSSDGYVISAVYY